MVFRGTHILVTLEFIFEVLNVLRVVCLDYPSHTHLRSISRDEMTSLFCVKAMVWGETLNFSTTVFAKGPRILNMVMIFVLTPRSHYNTITEPRAHFLLFFLENLSIHFHSHMIESTIDIYQDTATRDKLIFPSAITHILSHVHVTIPPPTPFSPWVPSARNLFGGVMHSWPLNGHMWSLLWRMLPMLLDLLLHILILLLLEQRFLLLPSWISFSSCVLILVGVLTIFPMRCVRWTPRLVASLTSSLALVVLLLLPYPSLLKSLFQMVEMMTMMMLLALRLMMRWLLLSDSPIVTQKKKRGGVVLYMRVVMLLQGELA